MGPTHCPVSELMTPLRVLLSFLRYFRIANYELFPLVFSCSFSMYLRSQKYPGGGRGRVWQGRRCKSVFSSACRGGAWETSLDDPWGTQRATGYITKGPSQIWVKCSSPIGSCSVEGRDLSLFPGCLLHLLEELGEEDSRKQGAVAAGSCGG